VLGGTAIIADCGYEKQQQLLIRNRRKAINADWG
jgi:hypothetical protein